MIQRALSPSSIAPIGHTGRVADGTVQIVERQKAVRHKRGSVDLGNRQNSIHGGKEVVSRQIAVQKGQRNLENRIERPRPEFGQRLDFVYPGIEKWQQARKAARKGLKPLELRAAEISERLTVVVEHLDPDIRKMRSSPVGSKHQVVACGEMLQTLRAPTIPASPNVIDNRSSLEFCNQVLRLEKG